MFPDTGSLLLILRPDHLIVWYPIQYKLFGNDLKTLFRIIPGGIYLCLQIDRHISVDLLCHADSLCKKLPAESRSSGFLRCKDSADRRILIVFGAWRKYTEICLYPFFI